MNLSHDPADIVRRLLIQLGQGSLPSANGNWPINVNNEPDVPDDCITIYNTVGKNSGRLMGGNFVDFPGIQVRIRTGDYSTGHSKSVNVEAALDGVQNDILTISGTSYIVNSLSRDSVLQFGGRDSPSSKRYFFTLNYFVTLSQL